MKKSILAAALLSCFASAGMAQSNVTIYGIMDASLARFDDGVNKVNRLDSGRNAASRLGFRGTEDLGGGLKAVFALESGMDASNGTLSGSGAMWNRWSYVGLEGGFGGLRAGRQDSPMRTALNVIDPFMNAG
ncbi:MAG TPA: porin, partial [Rhizobacter sp.]|nr:porin [Rhizobacter sp.]